MISVLKVMGLCVPLALGCSHRLSIDEFPESSTLAHAPLHSFVVGVVNHGGEPDTDEYVAAVADALQLQAPVERVIYPHVKGADVDVIAHVAVTPAYRGAWTNFLVNWPGFLVFAPAWNGYKYRADPKTTVQLATPAGDQVGDASWEFEYSFHQSDMGRTWTELSWLEYSVIAFVGGIIFTRYDTDQTPNFIEEVSDNYGAQVAAEIAHVLADYEPPPPPIPEPAPAMEEPALQLP